ncbi:MAG: NADH-quinone oxidoreductase subunit C [Ignavibacteriae bacterium]|nr:NADH-quinone oxidoreductase subunit C [Ignavibacteria bacterium]MBI3363958.1 NADH-quinone oxidoreductase subunit C [Ignavibacteriota bacterium]
MSPQEISEKLQSQFGAAILEAKIEGIIQPYIKVASVNVNDLALFLRDDADMQFDYLMCLSGIDYGKNVLGVVYHLSSMTKRHKITVKTDVPVEKAEVPSVADVWPTANWHEREAYDMYGIVFTGHPDLRRMLLPDDYPGHPLRKDFKVPEFYQGMKVPY